MDTSGTALVTGATSGLGFEAAAQLAEQGWSQVIITGRTAEKAALAGQELVARTGRDIFVPIAVDLNRTDDVTRAARVLRDRGDRISTLVLNAGMVSGSKLVKTDEDVEITFASSLIGHHQLTMQLLADGLLADDARIVIAGSEAARGDVPTFHPTDLNELAVKAYNGDKVAAAEGIIRADGTVTYKPATAYADAKMFVAWWAAQLAERLPAGMTVNAVSPGSAPETGAARNANLFMRYIMMPAFKHAPKRFGMSSSVSTAAGRYLQVIADDTGASGQFYASAPKKMTGPIEVVDLDHVSDSESQQAAWSAVVEVAGVDYPVSV